MDVIFSSGNGIARVDDLWFDHAVKTNVLGLIVRLCPAEEMIWSKAFIQERERFDGADVLHLLRETGPSLDWPRLLMRFGDHWRVLLGHLILFGYAYPDKRQNFPPWVMEELLRRLNASRPNLQNDVCYGTLLSREQYLHDIQRVEISGRSRSADRADDPRRNRDLDRRHRQEQVTRYCCRSRIQPTGLTSFSHRGRRRQPSSVISTLWARSLLKSTVRRSTTARSRIARFTSSLCSKDRLSTLSYR